MNASKFFSGLRDAIPAGTTPVTGNAGAPVAVVLYDSSRHTFPYCMSLLREIFGYSERAAYALTFEVHTCGCAIIWRGCREVAEWKCEEIAQFVPRAPFTNSVTAALPTPPNDIPPMEVTIENLVSL